MKTIAVLGSGKIGALISGLLGASNDYRVHLIDKDQDQVEKVANAHNLESVQAFSIDASDKAA
ncbi:MAG: saccharopine dehydrogenase NADP-binding domain-containing protein, partial [Pseudomonadota bacterium]